MQLNTVSTSDKIIHLELIGRMDTLALAEIEDEFTEATETLDHHLLFDIRKMPYITSLGIAMLISVEKSLKKRGLRVAILGPQPEVAVLLKQLRIGEIMPMFESLPEAAKYLNHR